MKQKKIVGMLALVGSMLAGSVAMAQTESPQAGHGSAAVLLGYGFKDGVGVGLGARGGYTLPVNVYLGGTFVYHLGKSVPGGTVNVFYLGFEGGYDIAAGPVIVRPYLGLGPAIAHASVNVCVPGAGCVGGSNSETRFSIWPGASVLYPVDNFFVGGDARVLVVEDFTAFSMFVTGGMTF